MYKDIIAAGNMEVQKRKQERHQLYIKAHYKKKMKNVEKVENKRLKLSAEIL